MGKLKGKSKSKARRNKRKNKTKDYARYRKNLLSKIRKFDDPILSETCETVNNNDNISEEVKLLTKVLGVTKEGVGLAASQVGITKRIIALRPDGKGGKISIMINPEIIEKSSEKKFGIEGCLSYPGTYAPIERYASIKVRYQDENLKEHEVKYSNGEMGGIVVQHEIDHLDGICELKEWYENPDKMKKDFEKIMEKENKEEDTNSKYEVEESEDLKKEKSENATEG